MGLGSSGFEEGKVLASGAFTGTNPPSDSFYLEGDANFSVWGTFVATIVVERSFDGGTTWMVLSTDSVGTPTAYTAPFSLTLNEPEAGVKYRARCSAYTSGTANYRVSR